MRTIHITHYHEPGYGWSFDSPDIPGLTGGPPNDADYAASCKHAESAVRFVLEGEAEERGVREPEDAVVRHVTATPAISEARAS